MMNNRGFQFAAIATLSAVVAACAVRMLKKDRKRPAVGKRVIFLDIDGVLNRTVTAKQIVMEEELLAKLKSIVDQSTSPEKGSPQIVLTTFWRTFDDYVAYVLHRHGFDGCLVVASTPGRSKSTPIQLSPIRHLLNNEAFHDMGLYTTRAHEIKMFLKRNPQVKSYVILDDRKDAAEDELLDHFVKTDPSVGISDEDVKRAVGLLN
jgi:hypothetical protein